MNVLASPISSALRIALIVAASALSSHAFAESSKSDPQLDGTLYVGGTGAAIGMLKILTADYQRVHPNVTPVVYPSLGSGGGIKALMAEKLTVSFSSRTLKEDEIAKGLQATEILKTPLIVATHPAVTVTSMTKSELAAHISREAIEWPDGTLVRPVLRPLYDADTQILMDQSDELESAVKQAHKHTGKNVAATDSDAADELERIPGALGMTTLVLVKAERRNLNIVNLDGIQPSLENLSSGAYAMSKTIYAVVRPDAGDLAKSFVEYLKSSQVQGLIQGMGGIPQKD